MSILFWASMGNKNFRCKINFWLLKVFSNCAVQFIKLQMKKLKKLLKMFKILFRKSVVNSKQRLLVAVADSHLANNLLVHNSR